MRISNVFKNFLNEFNSKTIRDSNITLYDLKVKYLSTLETLTWGLGRETAKPRSLRVCGEGEVSPIHTPSLGEEGPVYEVQVCGTTGISWRRKLQQVSDIIHIDRVQNVDCVYYMKWTWTWIINTLQDRAFLQDLYSHASLGLICSCYSRGKIAYWCFVFHPEQNALSLKDKSKSRKTKTDSKQKNDKKSEAANGWVLFSDFYEITHIVTKEAGVTIYRQDNKTMVNYPCLAEYQCYCSRITAVRVLHA